MRRLLTALALILTPGLAQAAQPILLKPARVWTAEDAGAPHTGWAVLVKDDKIAAVGVRVRHWVTYHGVALNRDPELEHFSAIVPCGITAAGFGVTSLAALGVRVSAAELDRLLEESFAEVFEAEYALRLASLEEALRLLDIAGLFGTGAERQEVLLIAGTEPPDAADAGFVRRLNPAGPLYDEWLRTCAEQPALRPGAPPVAAGEAEPNPALAELWRTTAGLLLPDGITVYGPDDIAERNAAGQPVLVGTISVEKSELVSRLLKRQGVPHEVLNAKYHEREASIVAQAGRSGAVTVATNMAGRGTDIMLGGNPDYLADLELHQRGLSPAETPEDFEAAWPEAVEKARRAVAEAEARAAQARYRATVLRAFVQVSDAMANLGSDQAAIDSLRQATRAAEVGAQDAQNGYKLGGNPLMDVVNTGRTLSLAHRYLAEAEGRRYADLVELYAATASDWRTAQ